MRRKPTAHCLSREFAHHLATSRLLLRVVHKAGNRIY